MPEFEHIHWLRHAFPPSNPHVIQSIGDDCAVIEQGDYYELITTDMLVSGDHFRLDWSSPEQIGMKAIEANISDIAAMGGIPVRALISVCLTGKEPSNFFEKFYAGIKKGCLFSNNTDAGYKIDIVGGDITKGINTIINVMMIGYVEKERCIFRNGAKIDDLICVTGNLGGSTAGLDYLRSYGREKIKKGIDATSLDYCLAKHLEPKCRFAAGRILSQYATAMIDVSDGLGSEVGHIAEESSVGAIIYENAIPIANEVKNMGEFLKKDPYMWALSGGEDFELVFTLPKNREKELIRTALEFYVVGKIVPKNKKKDGHNCLLKKRDGSEIPLPGGYEHQV